MTLLRWGSCVDLLKKGSCWYAVVISLKQLNMVDEILKTYLPWFCATLYVFPHKMKLVVLSLYPV